MKPEYEQGHKSATFRPDLITPEVRAKMGAAKKRVLVEKSPASESSAFEVEPIFIKFECSHAVYPKNGNGSMCYVTSEERGNLVAAALDDFKASGKMDEWFKQNGK